MKYLFFLLPFLTVYSQEYINDDEFLKKLDASNMIGVKIKFLKDNDNTRGYSDFGKNKSTYPYLDYDKYVGRTATVVSQTDENLVLKMDDNNKTIYADWKNASKFTSLPTNVGIENILVAAKEAYIGKKFNYDYEEVIIENITYSEEDEQYSQLYAPYKVFYKLKNGEIKSIECYLTESHHYFATQSYDKVFEKLFSNLPVDTNINEDNIMKYFKTDVDEFEGVTKYYHNHFVNEEYLEYGLGVSINTNRTGLMCSVIEGDGSPIIILYSNNAGSDWIFHDYFKINIGSDIKLESSVEKSPIREVRSGGGIFELNSYNSPTDFEIIEKIASNTDEKIMIRFVGRQFKRDIEVEAEEKIGIKHSFQLYNFLKEKNK